MPGVLVVGAGVVGLTTAVELKSVYGDAIDVSIVSKDLPGDDSLLYTSPKAGAHWISTNQKENKDWHLQTYKKLQELSKIPEAFIKKYPLYLGDIVPEGKEVPPFEEPWFKDVVEDYQFLGTDPKFPQRHTIKSLAEAEDYILPSSQQKPDLVVNCTGLQYNFLNDCHDPLLKPVRGHVLLVENNLPYQVTFEQPYLSPGDKEGEFLMLFPRPEGGGILGGIYDRNFTSFDTSIDNDYVQRLINKAAKHLPELGAETGHLKIAKHTIGFRPEREGGARIGQDPVHPKIVHNYGNGNSGYIESWGCASSTVKLIGGIIFSKPKL